MSWKFVHLLVTLNVRCALGQRMYAHSTKDQDWSGICSRVVKHVQCENVFRHGAVVLNASVDNIKALGPDVQISGEEFVGTRGGTIFPYATLTEAPHGVVAFKYNTYIDGKRRLLQQASETNAPYHLTFLHTQKRRACKRWEECRSDNTHDFVYSRTGQGVTVYQVADGINLNHVDFQLSRVSHGAGPLDRKSPCSEWFGSHYAGIVNGAINGVAKQAHVVAVTRSAGCMEPFAMHDLFKAIQWVKHKIDTEGAGRSIVVLHDVLQVSQHSSVTISLFEDLVSDLLKTGVVVIAAAGARSDNACNYTPQRFTDVITVGALDTIISPERTGSNVPIVSPWQFSNSGECVDIWAPGSHIQSAWAPGVDRSAVVSGTSEAASLVAGVSALIVQNLNAPVDVRAELIKASAKHLLLSPPPNSTQAVLQMPEFS